MSLASWLRETIIGSSKPNPHYLQARAAIADLNSSAGDLNETLRGKIPYSPFRAIVLDLQKQHEVSEYDQRQASDIYETKVPK